MPCPAGAWDEDARGLMLVMLPVVGAVVGFLWSGAALLARAFLPATLAAAVIAAAPWLLTGFIHLDGFMDTSDAILSWRPLEKRREILKDAHVGGFAVASVAMLALFGYAAAQGGFDLRALALVPVVSRCGSALCVITLRPLEHSEYARLDGSAAQRLAIAAIWLIAMVAGVVWLGRSALALGVETLAYIAAMAWAVGALRGVSGDLAGFALTVSECAALIALCVIGG